MISFILILLLTNASSLVVAEKRSVFSLDVTEEEEHPGYTVTISHPGSYSSLNGLLLKKTSSDYEYDVSLKAVTFLSGDKTLLDLNGTLSLLPNENGYRVNASLEGKYNDKNDFQYKMDFDRKLTCPQYNLFHSLSVDTGLECKSSLKTENCQDSLGDNSHLRIDLNLTDPENPFIDRTTLKQLLVFQNDSGYETMNMTGPLMDIQVNAEWKDLKKEDLTSRKKAVFKSHVDLIPSFEIHYLRDQEQVMLKLLHSLPLKQSDEEFKRQEL